MRFTSTNAAVGALVGEAREVDLATQTADVAFVVDDAWQRRGLGPLLLARLAQLARERSLVGFTADVLSSNKGMLGAFQASRLRYETQREGNVNRVVLRFRRASHARSHSVESA